jgi:hypothetical protein
MLSTFPSQKMAIVYFIITLSAFMEKVNADNLGDEYSVLWLDITVHGLPA